MTTTYRIPELVLDVFGFIPHNVRMNHHDLTLNTQTETPDGTLIQVFNYCGQRFTIVTGDGWTTAEFEGQLYDVEFPNLGVPKALDRALDLIDAGLYAEGV